jgi:hypothetical protein
LTHALQDQHFEVMKVLKEDIKQNNDDRAMAHQALFEGDATVVMLNYELEPVKRTFSQLPDLAFAMRTLMASMQSQFPVFKTAPVFLQESMFFPYSYGAAFLQKAWAQSPSWEYVNKIYADLPSSTEQILHPEKYFVTRDEPKPAAAEELASKLGGEWKIVYKNVLGEFSLHLLLNVHLSEERAKRSAAGWGGDQILLLENAAGKNALLVHTVWDTDTDADEFFQAMQEWLLRKYPNTPRSDETPAGFSLVTDSEVHMLRRDGTGVRFVLGFPESDAQKLRIF